jgi:hypothetical protein
MSSARPPERANSLTVGQGRRPKDASVTASFAASRHQVIGWTLMVAREWGWRQTALALGVGTLSAIQSGILTQHVDTALQYLMWWIYQVCDWGFTTVFAVSVANRAVDSGVGRFKAYVSALTFGLVVGGWLGNSLVGVFDPANSNPLAPPLRPLAGEIPVIALAVAAYAHWRHERRTLARVRDREIERARHEQGLRAAQLLALQARVEPQLLFDTMKRIADLIASSPPKADALLADLIAMLRAMLPMTGADASTVAREVALVESYGRVVSSSPLQPPALQMTIAADAATARLAPMVLLPALKSLVAAGATGLRLRVACEAAQRLHLTLIAGFDPALPLLAPPINADSLRETLVAVHGDTAALRFEAGPATTTLHIDLPYRDDQGLDR